MWSLVVLVPDHCLTLDSMVLERQNGGVGILMTLGTCGYVNVG